jgi:tRNA(Ile)-lysidine synthetase-like protein
MNILRGAGTDGLAGMELGGGRVIRPLLDISRHEIEAYDALHKLHPRLDASNSDNAYTRNRIRNELIPYIIEKFNPNITDALSRLAHVASWDREYLALEAESAFAACLVAGVGAHPALPREWGAGEHPALPREWGAGERRLCGGIYADSPNGGEAPARTACIAKPLRDGGAARPGLRASRRAAAERQLYGGICADSPDACVALSLEALRGLREAVMSRVIKIAAASVRGSAQDFHLTHVRKVMELVCGGEASASAPAAVAKAEFAAGSPAAASAAANAAGAGSGAASGAGRQLHMPGGLRILKSYQIIIFYKNSPARGGNIGQTGGRRPAAPQNCAVMPQLIKSFHKKDFEIIEEIKNISYNSFVQFFDADILGLDECAVRRRMPGDVFFPYGAPCAKKLREYFIDEKIPAGVRDSVWLMAAGSEVVWALGYGISEKHRVTERTETVLRAEFRAPGCP